MIIAKGEHGMRVGDIAEATGLTVRTLHHYEDVGLVMPSGRSSAGHRLYDAAALDQLYRVSMLRALGMSLSQIRHTVDLDQPQLRDAIAEHLAMVDEQTAQQQRLHSRLTSLLERLDVNAAASQDLLEILQEVVKMNPTLEHRISILVYSDLEAAHQYLVDVFGFHSG